MLQTIRKQLIFSITGLFITMLLVLITLNFAPSFSNFLKVFLIVVFFVVACGFLFFAINSINHTTRALFNLRKEMEKMAGRDNLILDPTGKLDEIESLSLALKHLTDHLNHQFDELETERKTLAAVLSNMSDGVMIVDSEGKIQLTNPAAKTMFTVPDESIEQLTLVEVVRHHQLVDLWQKSLNTQTSQSTTLETSMDRFFIQAIATPLGDILPGGILMVFQDLTRIRRLETVRKDFVSNVSHELRTPLASLKALTETLREGALDDPPAAQRFLSRMENEIDNLTQMVQELLELSRIESGLVPLERRNTSPGELLNSAVERMMLQAQRAGLTLTHQCPANLPPVFVDNQRMGQVLINLIHNAIKFTPPGGSITASAYRQGNEIIFYIKDTGEGITPDALKRIFERFYKTDRSRSGGGTGLGLSISRHLVEAHNGRIWAESKLGEGSTFYFSLPLHPAG
ncbi:MAG: cell wall metabolism sensor histidine kinase WalK [Anaerolineae bacterium]|nr:cell wall metabolism sensor histidine kinase WalK [Anaerolineae bacterium]